ILIPAFLAARVDGQYTDIVIETYNNALVLQTDGNSYLNTIYYGKKLSDKHDYTNIPGLYKQSAEYTGMLASAYTPSGSRNLMEPAITVTHPDGNNSLDLKYISHNQTRPDSNTTLTTIILKDPVYDFQVTLYYKAYTREDVIEQWSVIRHNEKGNVVLHKFASANLFLKAREYWLTQYHGDWIREMQPEESKITHGIKTLDSKLGTRPNLFQPSVFMVSLNSRSTEDNGTVLYGALEYSGNFKTDLELDYQDNLRIISGINNYASAYTLKPNEEFVTPAFLHVLSNTGRGTASRSLHRWARNYKIPDGNGNRLTLLNNWEATYFNFNESKLFDLIKDTRKLGVDMFLLDDGWFGNKHPRNGDTAGLGDWQENKTKLPNGITSLVKEALNNNIKFGLWVEPEMVNPKSDLYEHHPDWIVKQPARPEHYLRNQLVLDLSNPKVQNFVFGIIDTLLTKNPAPAYLKWDCNTVIFNAGSAYQKNQNHFYIEYMRGLYNVLNKIRSKYPKLPMMLCSGGGGRVDYAALQYFTEYWPSDNTDPLERIYMQWEYSYFYPSLTSSNHVTDWGKQSIKFKTDVAMMGKPGFDIVVSKMEEKDLHFCQQAIKTFNTVKQTIWQGDQYRLSDPHTENIASVMYVNEGMDAAVMFNYLVSNRQDAGSHLPILLKGLDVKKKYRLAEINLYPDSKSSIDPQATYSGEFLMTIGFNPKVNASRPSVVLQISEAGM
ncbi:MAG TPA: alpha-galactosidase, partial [Flavitalea sp.]|nr:alpha-galactosidase [Flavitalea sp.]